MKNMKYFLSAVVAVGTLAGCSKGWNEDPLAEKNKVLQEGQQTPTKDEKPKGTGSDTVRLDMNPETYTFQEGSAGEVIFKARVLSTGYTAAVSIDNLADFPGARFDAASGKFNWTPALGTVTGDSGSTTEAKILKFTVVGSKPGEGVLSQTFNMKLDVSKILNAPEIFSVSNSNMYMREGDVQNITIKIRDKDAGTSPGSWPIVQAWPILGYANLSQFVTVTSTTPTPGVAGEFTVNLKIDLTGAELTNKKAAYGFGLMAISHFQKGSPQQNVYVSVLTSFATLKTTWVGFLNYSLGIKAVNQFLIFDPREELAVAKPTFTNIPSGASFDCVVSTISSQLCTMTWSPDFTTAAGDFTVNASVVSRNQDQADTAVKTQNFDLQMRVSPGGPVMSPLSHKEGK